MESAEFRQRRSPSSDRFLGLFAVSPPTSAGGGGELIEAEVFWTGDFSEPAIRRDQNHRRDHRTATVFSQRSGILAVLPDFDRSYDRQFIYRKASPSPARLIPSIPAIPAIPKPSAVNQSAPVNVPALEKAMASRRRSLEALEAFDAEEEEGDEKILPPHGISAARGFSGDGGSPMTTFSVLEGVGRTLKGRDLRQVRNAIWRKTGFLD